jgi:hypothetical protein
VERVVVERVVVERVMVERVVVERVMVERVVVERVVVERVVVERVMVERAVVERAVVERVVVERVVVVTEEEMRVEVTVVEARLPSGSWCRRCQWTGPSAAPTPRLSPTARTQIQSCSVRASRRPLAASACHSPSQGRATYPAARPHRVGPSTGNCRERHSLRWEERAHVKYCEMTHDVCGVVGSWRSRGIGV